LKRYNLLTFLIFILFIVACEDKKKSSSSNTIDHNNKSFTTHKTKTDIFYLEDTDKKNHQVTLEDKKIIVSNISQSTIIINIYKKKSTISKAQITFLNKLKNQHSKQLSVFTLEKMQNLQLLSKLQETLNLNKYIRFPLTIIYKNGNYYSHFEGAIPIEMLQYDINEALKQ